jgi:hypothetical protein
MDRPYYIQSVWVTCSEIVPVPLEGGPVVVPPGRTSGRTRHWSKAANPDGHRSLFTLNHSLIRYFASTFVRYVLCETNQQQQCRPCSLFTIHCLLFTSHAPTGRVLTMPINGLATMQPDEIHKRYSSHTTKSDDHPFGLRSD